MPLIVGADRLFRRGMMAALLATPGVAGCADTGSRDVPEVFPVQGHVLQAGRPVAGALVTFHRDGAVAGVNVTPSGKIGESGVRPSARTDEQGAYALTTFAAGDGAPPGNYVATIYWPAAPLNEDDLEAPWPPDRLRGAYNSPERPKLNFEVLPKDNTIDINIP